MSKNFDDFMEKISSKDWSLVVESISEKINGKTPEEAMILTNLYANATILKEYHEWLHE